MIADFGIRNSEFGFRFVKVGQPPVKHQVSDLGLRILCSANTPRSQFSQWRTSQMNKKDLEQRTKRFALRIISFVGRLPKGSIADVLAYQLLKAGTSVGGNYREANRVNQGTTSFTRSRLLRRSRRKVNIGLNCLTNRISAKSPNAVGFALRPASSWPFSRRSVEVQNNRRKPLQVDVNSRRCLITKSEIRSPKSEMERPCAYPSYRRCRLYWLSSL